jgi:hypothetical protein
LEPKTLPLPSPAKPDDAPVPNPNPVVGFPPKAPKPLIAGVVVVDVVDPALANAPNPDVLVLAALLPNTLGFVAPRLPKGEVLELARDANPEVANAEADVCDLSLDMVKDKGLLIDSVFSSVPSVVDFAGSEEAESTCEKSISERARPWIRSTEKQADLCCVCLLSSLGEVFRCISRSPLLLWL